MVARDVQRVVASIAAATIAAGRPSVARRCRHRSSHGANAAASVRHRPGRSSAPPTAAASARNVDVWSAPCACIVRTRSSNSCWSPSSTSTSPSLARHACLPVGAEPIGERRQHVGGRGDRGVDVVVEQCEQALGQSRQVPLRDRWLIAVGVATAVVDRAEHRGRVVGIDERARPVVDGLTRDRHVVGVHHAVDEADQHPLRDQRGLRLDDVLVERRRTAGASPATAGSAGRWRSRRAGEGVRGRRGRTVYSNVPTRRWLAATRVSTAPGSIPSRWMRSPGGDDGQPTGGGDAERVHRLADQQLAQHRPDGRLAVAAASERRAARIPSGARRVAGRAYRSPRPAAARARRPAAASSCRTGARRRPSRSEPPRPACWCPSARQAPAEWTASLRRGRARRRDRVQGEELRCLDGNSVPRESQLAQLVGEGVLEPELVGGRGAHRFKTTDATRSPGAEALGALRRFRSQAGQR